MMPAPPPRRAALAILLLGPILVSGLILASSSRAQAAGGTELGRVDSIRARDHLTCGVAPGIAGFAEMEADGRAHGFDIDLCRAVAAAILGDPGRVRFAPANAVTDLAAMPELDLVIRRLTWTLTREAADGLIFGPIVFYDGQGFLVPAAAGITAPAGLRGKPVCVDPGEDWARTLRRYGQRSGLDLGLVVTAGPADSLKRLIGGDCAAYSADQSMLAAIRSTAPDPAAFRILGQQISKEPLAPLLRAGDDPFFQIVRWTVFALVDAEELGITSANVHAMRESADPNRDPAIARLLGAIPGNGKALGLPEDWAYRVIASLGNYGEIFDRNLGAASRVKLDRGLNRLWTQGGLLYAPPAR